jgi:hypothetical protein
MATTISEAAVSPTIRAVMLDYGEVLCFLPTADDIARMAQIFGIDPGAFLPIYLHSRGPYDRRSPTRRILARIRVPGWGHARRGCD